MQSITFVGLDVHKATIAVSVAEGGRNGEGRHLGRVENRPEVSAGWSNVCGGRPGAPGGLRGRPVRLRLAPAAHRPPLRLRGGGAGSDSRGVLAIGSRRTAVTPRPWRRCTGPAS
jgi:hypothetical protein